MTSCQTRQRMRIVGDCSAEIVTSGWQLSFLSLPLPSTCRLSQGSFRYGWRWAEGSIKASPGRDFGTTPSNTTIHAGRTQNPSGWQSPSSWVGRSFFGSVVIGVVAFVYLLGSLKARLHMRFLMRFPMRFREQNAPYPTLHECFFREVSRGLGRKLSHIFCRHPSSKSLLAWRYFVAALRD